MRISVHKTDKIRANEQALTSLIDRFISDVPEQSIVVISAKIVSLCEGSVAGADSNKDELIQQAAQYYIPRTVSQYNSSFTITNNVFIPGAGIDESNADGQYILWPKDAQASANSVREHLVQTRGLQNLGVIICDSTSRILQWGTTGIALSHSGFAGLNDYAGSSDIFGKVMKFQKANISGGLAAAAVLAMGEGNEQTPLAVIEDVPFVQFQDRNPTTEELNYLRIEPEDDLFWPVIGTAPWQKLN